MQLTISADNIFGVCWCHLGASLTNSMDPYKTAPSMDPYKTAPLGSVLLGSEMFACKL